jgi:hypothetical protein
LHGSITVHDGAGQRGTVFEVTLPARRPEPAAPPNAPPRPSISTTESADKIDAGVP